MKNLKDYVINVSEKLKLTKSTKIEETGPIGFSDLADILMKLDTRYGKPIEIKSLTNSELTKENALYHFIPKGDLYYLINQEVEKNDDDAYIYNFFIRVSTMQHSTPKDMISISLEEYGEYGLWEGNIFNLGAKNKQEERVYHWFFLKNHENFIKEFKLFINSIYNRPLDMQKQKFQIFNEFCMNASSVDYFDFVDEFDTIL